ncbi:50S ribosomal protein L13 [Candidatus Aerophobetes bacterium Ae_b3a]|nr:MAG: 50S ribosomal protein L13 [Candidatus Aerophobetes bacterium Ae_b3a]
MKTYVPKKTEIKKNWYLVDAEGKILGRLASKIAQILSGKNKPIYTPFLDTGDFVVVINAKKVKVTGNKEKKKIYYHYSGYPGGMKEIVYEKLLEKKPALIIQKAVRGMLPKNKLRSKMLKKLKIYAGPEHRHQAQNPEKIEL